MITQAKANVRADVKQRISSVLTRRGNGQENVRLVEPAMPVTWGGEESERNWFPMGCVGVREAGGGGVLDIMH